MANTVILGVYTSKTALDTAEKATASEGDTYIVGSKIPYTLYTFKGTAFSKGKTVSDAATDLSVSINDLPNIAFSGEDGKTIKFRKGLKIGEWQTYNPGS